VGEDSEMWVFYSDPTNGDGDLYPDAILKLTRDKEGEVSYVLEPA
jgi:hypothetical protein